MTLPDIFNPTTTASLVERLNSLDENTKPNWGKMTAAQMIAHQNVMFEFALTNKHQRPNAIIRFLLKKLAKDKVVNDQPYPKNGRTAPQMLITDMPSFEDERDKAIRFLAELDEKGKPYFNGKEHPSFGKLSSEEWSNLFYKHIDHHLNQFGI